MTPIISRLAEQNGLKWHKIITLTHPSVYIFLVEASIFAVFVLTIIAFSKKRQILLGTIEINFWIEFKEALKKKEKKIDSRGRESKDPHSESLFCKQAYK